MGVRYKLFTLAFIFHFFLILKAQNNDLYNVKLKSGLIIKCELISFLPDSTVSIRQYGMVSTLDCRDIVSIEHSGFKISDTIRTVNVYYAPVKPKRVFRNVPENVWTHGIQLCIGANGGGGYVIGNNSVTFSSMTGLNKHMEVGFCTGLDAYEEDWVLGVIAGQFRYCMLANRYKTPMIYTQLGYGFNFSEVNPATYGGVNFASGIGMTSRTRTQDIFSLMVGFKLQKLTDDVHYWRLNNTVVQEVFTLMGAEVKIEWRF